MSTTLLNHLQKVFTPSAVSELARVLGENTTATQKAVDGLLPTIISGVINQASDETGATRLYNLLNSTPFDTDPTMSQLVETSGHRQKAAESGNALLKQLYGERVHELAAATHQYSGVSLGSATTLTGLVMSVLMGFLHQQLATRNLNQTQLAALLHDEASSVHGLIPAALAGLLGWFVVAGGPVTQGPVTTAIPAANPVQTGRDEDTKAAGFPWLRWLLIGLGLLLLLFLLLRSCNRDTGQTTTAPNEPASTATDTVASDLDGNERATAGPEVRVAVDLPGGRKLSLVERSFNYSLAQYLAAKGSTTPKVFTFDNLTFETDSARITAQARPHVDDLIQIMQAYPNLTIRIEGNTDSTGDDAINDPLSSQRAQAVKDELVKAGIQANRVATRELGDTKPVASNQTEAGRQKNRRIDVVVTRI